MEIKMKANASQTIDVPPDAVWAVIAQGGDVHRWFGAAITTCELIGEGEGAARQCTMANGALLKERILEVDHDARRFRYAVDEHLLPASDVIATITVTEANDGKTTVSWGADYAAAPGQDDLMQETLEALYVQGIQSLETYLAKAA
jgi:uncharacterized protein YndB with AHSA1/START domain